MARERYLLNAGEDTIHQNVITADTPKEKCQNWWFYHKGHVIVAVLVLACVFSIFWSIFSKVSPDYSIALTTSFTMPESGIDELERCIAQYADDRNGDGKVVVTVQNYVFPANNPNSPDDANRQEIALTKFMADAISNESMIFLHDETAFSILENNFGGFFLYNDGTPMPESALDFENAMRPWGEFAAFSGFEPVIEDDYSFDSEMMTTLYQRLRVSFRSSEGSTIENKEKTKAYYKDCQELYRRLETGELPAAAQNE